MAPLLHRSNFKHRKIMKKILSLGSVVFILTVSFIVSCSSNGGGVDVDLKMQCAIRSERIITWSWIRCSTKYFGRCLRAEAMWRILSYLLILLGQTILLSLYSLITRYLIVSICWQFRRVKKLKSKRLFHKCMQIVYREKLIRLLYLSRRISIWPIKHDWNL